MTSEQALFIFDNPHLFSESAQDDAIAKAKEALEKADQYKWHDLKKNSKDLPPDNVDVLVYLASGRVCVASRDWGWECYEIGEHTSVVLADVLAWKYIEPFESGVEEQ